MLEPMFLLFLFLTFTSPSPVQEPSLDFSCATFHPFISERDLVQEFGRENVTNGPLFREDDGPVEGTILFPASDDRRVEVLWHDAAQKQRPALIRVRGERSRWRTPHGLGVGDDLRTVEQKNGWPFRLAGFSSEGGGGRLLNWSGGRLGNIPHC